MTVRPVASAMVQETSFSALMLMRADPWAVGEKVMAVRLRIAVKRVWRGRGRGRWGQVR
jgi:hypothetical protein